MKKMVSFLGNIMGRIMPNTLSRLSFRMTQNKKLDLDNPTSFNEKLMWLKINNYNNNPEVWKCCDKYLVREYARNKGISEENLPELIGVYKDAYEIDFNELPKKFALKCTHGCGFNVICTNKSILDIDRTRKVLNKYLKMKFGYTTAELHYTHEKPRIICEKFIEGFDNLPYDYKIYCFNGIAKCVLVCSERDKLLRLNFYNLAWEEMPLGKESLRNKKTINKPKTLKEMITIAEKVSKPFPFVRVDFYESNNIPILGELTFTPAACIARYYSEFGNKYLGDLLTLL